jgi:hypothetical protein
MLKIGMTLARRKLGFRGLLEVTPLDASLVRGSHGRITTDVAESPLFATQQVDLVRGERIQATEVHDLLLQHLGIGVAATV